MAATQKSRVDIQSIKPGVRRKVLAVSYLVSRSVRKVAHCHRSAKPSARAGIPKGSLVFAQAPRAKPEPYFPVAAGTLISSLYFSSSEGTQTSSRMASFVVRVQVDFMPTHGAV